MLAFGALTLLKKKKKNFLGWVPPLPELMREVNYASIVCTNNMGYTEHLLFFWKSNIWVYARHGNVYMVSPNKKSWHKVSN